jgi:hypothetical protein
MRKSPSTGQARSHHLGTSSSDDHEAQGGAEEVAKDGDILARISTRYHHFKGLTATS